ncbi:MAG: hypothetical protein QOI20_595 [Acidimicrobiaceae bacterium]|jgi:hypothetical protein|nr:hypothetical protein [Acidimicrobiaceae bacterium]
MAPVAHVVHLARRFVGSLASGGPSPQDEAWVLSLVSEAELSLWRRMDGPDQRHAAGVARRVSRSLSERAALVAALLHDVGKVESGLGTFERVGATVARPWRDRPVVPGRWRRYYDHPALGAELLALADSDPLVVAWAREHHLPPARWTVPAEVGRVLKAADDD